MVLNKNFHGLKVEKEVIPEVESSFNELVRSNNSFSHTSSSKSVVGNEINFAIEKSEIYHKDCDKMAKISKSKYSNLAHSYHHKHHLMH